MNPKRTSSPLGEAHSRAKTGIRDLNPAGDVKAGNCAKGVHYPSDGTITHRKAGGTSPVEY